MTRPQTADWPDRQCSRLQAGSSLEKYTSLLHFIYYIAEYICDASMQFSLNVAKSITNKFKEIERFNFQNLISGYGNK